MTWIEDLGTYLQSHNYGAVGSTIFYNSFKAEVQNSICLIEKAGFQEMGTASNDLTIFRPELGIRVRNASGKTAQTTAKSIHDYLNQTYNTLIGSTNFLSIEAIAREYFDSKTETEGTIYSVNFYIEYF